MFVIGALVILSIGTVLAGVMGISMSVVMYKVQGALSMALMDIFMSASISFVEDKMFLW